MPDHHSQKDVVSILQQAYDQVHVANLKKKKQHNILDDFANFVMQKEEVIHLNPMKRYPLILLPMITFPMIAETIEGNAQWMECRTIIMKKKMIT
jgi:hypothetical protein